MTAVFTYTNIAANGATTVKNTRGVLSKIIINKIGASSNTLTVYDGTDTNGTVIGTIDTTIAAAPPRHYDIQFNTGLHVVMGTGTTADVTICWE